MVEYAGATVRTSDLFGQNSKNPLSMTKKFMKGLKVSFIYNMSGEWIKSVGKAFWYKGVVSLCPKVHRSTFKIERLTKIKSRTKVAQTVMKMMILTLQCW